MLILHRTSQQAFAMLGQDNLWTTARRCHEALTGSGLPYAIVGGVAVSLHGYQRSTVDVDLLVRHEDSAAVRECFESNGFTWDLENRAYRDGNGIAVEFLLSSETAGSGLELPDPAAPGITTEIEGLAVVSLARLIELKMACGLSNLRRTYRNLADVIELIAVHQLGRDFARHLHKSLRKEFRALVLRSRGETG